MYPFPCFGCKEGHYDPNCNEDCLSWREYMKRLVWEALKERDREPARVVCDEYE